MARTLPFDAAELLDSDDRIAAYLDEALATGDAAFIAHALGLVARARGMSHLARAEGLSRESLYKALSENGNPEFTTIPKVVQALGLSLSVQPAADKAA